MAAAKTGTSLAEIVRILKERTSHDFARYKRSTLERRVLRRMSLLDISSAAKYVALLRKEPGEADAMFQELLIGVTQFFRDPEAFAALEEHVIPSLLAKPAAEPVRIWIPGCSTGEEAYSVAILLAERMTARRQPPRPIQIFATDLDERALALARKGLFSDDIAAQITPKRLLRHFSRRGRKFEAREELRSWCVFSLHNLIKDPPFSKLDLISCRNLLIYLEPEVQRKLLPLFHHSLNPGGYLFLGPSENFAARSELFVPVDKKHRIFQRKPSLLTKPGELQLPDAGRVTRQPAPALPLPPVSAGVTRSIERVLLDDFTPPSIVVDGRGDVLYFFGRIGQFIEPQSGAASHKIGQLVRKDLRLELRGALHQAVHGRREVVRRVAATGRTRPGLDLIVRPLPEAGRDAGLYIVLFQWVAVAREGPRLRAAPKEGAVIEELQRELQGARDDLQASIEELETSNEELKSANEELLSMNEEFQSTNEELQTSKEELQSANDDLQRKHDELEAADNDLQNFFQSAQVATMFVDVALHLRRHTPALARLVAGIDQDLGKPVLPLLRRFAPNADWQALISEALQGRVGQRRISSLAGPGVSLVRVTPYRIAEGEIQGVVVTFTDISQAVVAEREHEQLAAIVRNSLDAIVSKDLEGIITSWNTAAERMFGFTAQEAVAKPILIIVPSDRYEEERRILSEIRAGRRVETFETYRRHREGRLVPVSVTISPIRDSDGNIIGASKIARDISERDAAGQLQQQLAAIVESSHDAILSKDLMGRIRTWNEAAEHIFGYPRAEAIGQSIDIILAPGNEREEMELLERVKQGILVQQFQTVRRRKDGSLIHVSLTISPIRDATGAVIGASSIARDISAAKRAERDVQEARDLLAHANQTLEERIRGRTAELVETNAQLESLVYSIAHDLRAPLRAMRAFAGLIIEEQGERLTEDGRQYAHRIARAAETMDRLVLDLLNYGRAARAEMDLAAVDLPGAWQAALAQNEQLLKESRAEVDAAQLVGGVLANEPTLVQILANLLNNAIKFTVPGIPPRIRAAAEPRGERLRIWIEDQGVGIPPQYHERIFRVFERLEPGSSTGTGIGLAIVRKGAERMGGQAGVESAPGAGSRFWVELPVPASR